ncbi:MAG: hypothetical protein QOF11_2195, partial [Chloroflexota bacterium]|nr:hypothetical protein [Chloroflexota bacterium]
MIGLDERVCAWSYRRQRLGRSAPDLASVLSDVVAVYSTQPTAILALAARVADLSANDFRRLDLDRSAVRLPAMRSSGHLVPTDTAATVFAATRRPIEAMAWIWRGIGLSAAEYARAKSAILAVA